MAVEKKGDGIKKLPKENINGQFCLFTGELTLKFRTANR